MARAWVRTTQLFCASQHSDVARQFRTAVSLHGHTLHSEERLDFIPRLCGSIPLLRFLLDTCRRRYQAVYGRPLDFSSAWWTPPLCARQAVELEREQIERFADWNAVVSITDHDSIEGIRRLPTTSRPPIASIEWTVPFGPSFFHIGVHNLPPDCHAQIAAMRAYTRSPSAGRIAELLAWIARDPGTLIVFNHPLWDEKGIGIGAHRQLADRFLGRCRESIHALEANGIRPWSENRTVIDLAQRLGIPVISGGDRHGWEPNALLNLTHASSFGEFVEEIRSDGCTRILLMPQYRQSRRLRMAHTLFDVLREYPHHPPGQRFWSDRILYERPDGAVRSLTELWDGNPPVLFRSLVHISRLIQKNPWRSGLHLALGSAEQPVI